MTTRVYGVVLQATTGAGGSGGYGFMIRGTGNETYSNTLGLGEVEAVNDPNTNGAKIYRTESIQLVPKALTVTIGN